MRAESGEAKLLSRLNTLLQWGRPSMRAESERLTEWEEANG